MPELNEDVWRVLVRTIKNGDCVPFLGAGASMGYDGGPGLPTGSELSRQIAADCNYQGAEPEDFLRVCQFYELTDGPHMLRKFIIERLNVPGLQPGKIHKTIANLPVTYVITTNYDCLMERAFAEAGKQPQVAIHNFRGKSPVTVKPATIREPVVYKLHGSMEQPASMICTEDDVVQFLSGLIHDKPPLPPVIKELFEQRAFLFLGYGLRDWNVRVMIRTLRWDNPGPDWIKSFAVQRRPSDLKHAYDWDHTVIYFDRRESILCFDHDALDFVSQLKSRVDGP